jgi:AraC family transcriptional regulator
MFESQAQPGVRSLFSDAVISARVACSKHVRVEFLRCPTDSTVRWNVAAPDISLMWVRDKGSKARFTMAGSRPEPVIPGRGHFWFFPEGSDARGEVTGQGDYDCAGVFVDPTVLPAEVKHALAEPMAGSSQGGLGRAFDGLAAELAEPEDVLPLFTEGWAMQALAHVARSASATPPRRSNYATGLAPWQLRRARDMLREHIDGNPDLEAVARTCRLSIGHFSRAFKASTGVPPHQWLMLERVAMAEGLLAKSSTPLVHVAGMCGFADQSHFCRVFTRFKGCSPGVWRREHWSQ